MTKNKSNALSKLLAGFIIIIGVGVYINSVLKDWNVEQDLGSNYIFVLTVKSFISRAMKSLLNMSYLSVRQNTVSTSVGL